MRIVVTLTSTPDRVNKIKVTIDSIYKQSIQVDKIYLTVPQKSMRGKPYPEIEPEIAKLVEIVPVPVDHGPVCKILGALIRESDPETLIVSIDDDNIYPENLIESLLAGKRKYPEMAIGTAGFIFGSFPFFGRGKFNIGHKKYWFNVPDETKVDYLNGFGGILYERGWFPPVQRIDKDFLKYLDMTQTNNLRMNDDIFLAAFLDSQDIERIVVSCDPIVKNDFKDGISNNMLKFPYSIYSAIDDAKRLKLYRKMRGEYHCHDTITAPIALLALIIIILVIIVILALVARKYAPQYYF